MKGKIILRKLFQIFKYLIAHLGTRIKLFLSQISGLLKWGLLTSNRRIKSYTIRTITIAIPVLYFIKEKILVGHFGIILLDQLDGKDSIVLKYLLKSLQKIIRIFPRNFCIPPISEIFSKVIPLLNNRSFIVDSELIKLINLILDKEWFYLPKKDIVLLLVNIVKTQGKLSIEDRKITMKIIFKISGAYGSIEIINFLLGFLEKKNGIFRLSLIVVITALADVQGLHLVFPVLFNNFFKCDSVTNYNVFKTLIYILEYVDSNKLLNYSNSLGIIIESELIKKKEKSDPLLFMFIGKFSQKFNFSGFEKKLTFIFKFILVHFLISSKSNFKYLFYAFEKLLLTLNPLMWWKFIFQGLFHKKKKVRILYWKFHRLLVLNRKLSFFF